LDECSCATRVVRTILLLVDPSASNLGHRASRFAALAGFGFGCSSLAKVRVVDLFLQSSKIQRKRSESNESVTGWRPYPTVKDRDDELTYYISSFSFSFALALATALSFSFAFTLATALSFAFAFSCTLASALSFAFAFAFAFAFTLSFTFTFSFTHALELKENKNV
jgi:hypothetical protein